MKPRSAGRCPRHVSASSSHGPLLLCSSFPTRVPPAKPSLIPTPLGYAANPVRPRCAPLPGVLPSKASFSLHSILVHHYLWGAWYPKGGSGEIVFRTIPIIQRAGGNVLGRAPVQSILLDSQGKACGERCIQDAAPPVPSVLPLPSALLPSRCERQEG